MTTTLIPTHTPAVPGGTRVTFGRLLRSEWLKLHTVRSTFWSYGILVALSLGMAALIAAATSQVEVQGGPPVGAVQAAVSAATFGAVLGQLILAVLGVLSISGEYTTGQIRSTITAAPKRLGALAAKAVVLFVSSFVVGLASSVGAYFVASPILAGQGLETSIADSEIVLALVSTAFYLAVVTVFGLGIGTVLRSTAGGVAAALGLILLLPIAVNLVPVQWVNDISPYLLQNVGFAIATAGDQLETWQEVLVTLAWPAVALALGALLLKRRDA